MCIRDRGLMGMARGSRFLNDNGSVLGLNTMDLMGAAGVMVAASEVLKPIRLDFLAIPVAVVALTALIPVRLRHRRKIIRDTLAFWIGARRVTKC